MKIDVFDIRNGDQRREMFCTVNDDQTVHYKISLFWNKHRGYIMKGDDCFVQPVNANGFQCTTYNNLISHQIISVVQAKGPGSMRYNKGKLRQLADIYLNPESNVFKLVLDNAIKQYQNSGSTYEAA